jgi:hypothetical protein
MNKKPINPLLLSGLILLFTIGPIFITNVYRAFGRNQNIWWTPSSLALPAEKTRNDFQLFIGGKLLQKHLSEGTLFVLDKEGEKYPVSSKDVRVRLNNWYKTRSNFLAKAVSTGFAFGIAITLFVVGLIQTFVQKRKPR